MSNTYETLCQLADQLEAVEIRRDVRSTRRGRGASFKSLRTDLICHDCNDGCKANCADTVRTFGAMHMNCKNVEIMQMG
tara:strand:- start:1351 stop:1587 length:237 start_codon:yes stop_codon:yes gene_type:complete